MPMGLAQVERALAGRKLPRLILTCKDFLALERGIFSILSY